VAIHTVQEYRPEHLRSADQSLDSALTQALEDVDRQTNSLELGWYVRRGDGGWFVDVAVQPRQGPAPRQPHALWTWWVADSGDLAAVSEAAAQLTPELPRAEDRVAAGP
jgi:hypothetical protein